MKGLWNIEKDVSLHVYKVNETGWEAEEDTIHWQGQWKESCGYDGWSGLNLLLNRCL